MNIVVLCGSPKGKKSITTGYVKYMSKVINLEFNYIDIGLRIKKIKKDNNLLKDIMKTIENADAIIWSTPVYYFTVPSQLIEFINLIQDNNLQHCFQRKLSTYITTSIRFFDNTAKLYLEKVIKRFKMELHQGLQFKMHDLIDDKHQKLLTNFSFDLISNLKESRMIETLSKDPIIQTFNYVQNKNKKINTTKRITIIADYNNNNDNIYKMVTAFKKQFISDIKIIDINNLDIKTGCIGCCKCGWDNTCVFKDIDEHNSLYKTKLDTADIIVFAANIKGDFFSATWKKFLDRNFFVNHAPRLIGRQFLWFISGDIKDKQYIPDMINGWAQINYSNVCGILSDLDGDSTYLSNKIERLAEAAIKYSEQDMIKPNNFLGVGGTKIFRDDVYGDLKFPFRNDHKIFKKLGYYDYPHLEIKKRAISSIMLFLGRLKGFRKHIFKTSNVMIDGMYKPIKKVLDNFNIYYR